MHTSKLLSSSDFQFRRLDREGAVGIDFDKFCPDYHELDRTGVVSPCLEDGVFDAGYAILAMTTAFYDVLRSRMDDFFEYPQHLAFLDMNDEGVNALRGRLRIDRGTIGKPWGNLDVWPESNWIATTGTVSGMLHKVYDLHINRLFWPEDFVPGPDEAILPAYVRRKMLKTRLTAVTYYSTSAPNVEVLVTQPVEDVVQASVDRLPEGEGRFREVIEPSDGDCLYVERYRQVGVDEFLEAMACCFDPEYE
jgi:hypothetical protein